MAMGASHTGAEACRRILVIEDEVKMARLVARTLAAAGFDVTTAANGLRGLSHVRSARFDLVILDLMLPDVDGLSILSCIQERQPGERVVVLSALGDVHSKVQCLEAGACDYVTKPFDLPELVARVRLRLRERRLNGADRVLEVDGYTLDLQRRTVSAGNGPVPLSTREFVLLGYLMEKAGAVCGRDELLEHVWGYTFDPATNVLEVYVRRLRGKLGGGCIQTVRNVGYVFAGA
jgi:two-component system copper resistance phosphate regulon response regulator CusR